MKFSIITPTLMRESLVRCCQSISEQTFSDWEHIVVSDGGVVDTAIEDKILHPQRMLILTQPTRQWGNHQRWYGWKFASAEFLSYVDDDNFMTDPDALQRMNDFLEGAGNPDWALFPIMRHGRQFLIDPPGMCMTDSANICAKREFGRWPDIEAREADGVLAEKLKAEHPYVAFPECATIITMEFSSNGV